MWKVLRCHVTESNEEGHEITTALSELEDPGTLVAGSELLIIAVKWRISMADGLTYVSCEVRHFMDRRLKCKHKMKAVISP